MTDVTATIVLYNSAAHLSECLEALRDSVDSGLAELVAVDNASPDESVAVVEQVLPSARVVRSPKNVGFAAGCNLAWTHVTGKYWLLLNPDVVLESGALPRLVDFMDAHSRVGAVSPWLRDPTTDTLVFPGRVFPSATRALLELTRLHRLLPYRWRARLLQGPYVVPGAAAGPEPGWVPGTAMLVRTEAARAVGLLDERFFLYGEDLEWCWRMRRHGWTIAVDDTAVATHHARASGQRTWTEDAVEERIAIGVLRACRLMRGPVRARVLGIAVAAAHALESVDPRRSGGQRTAAARVRRAWWRAVKHA